VPKLLLDEHLPPALAEALRKRGVNVIAVVETPLAALPDEHLFARAAELDRVIVTFNNPDFIAEITKFTAAHPNQQIPGVIFIPGKKDSCERSVSAYRGDRGGSETGRPRRGRSSVRIVDRLGLGA
jgi:hypothetical protein